MTWSPNPKYLASDIGDFYPIAQFQQLAKTVSQSSISKSSSRKSLTEPNISPRQEIYKSMLREIRNDDVTQMNSLVHKASGILRLEHYKNKANKNQRVKVSWDIDGRRVLNYEGKGGISRTELERETNHDKTSKKNLLASLNQPIFGLDFENFKLLSEDYDENRNECFNGSADCEKRNTVSKSWEDYIDTGDVSKLWESKEAVILKSKRGSNNSRTVSSRTSSTSLAESRTSIGSGSSVGPRPPWKYFVKPSRDRIKSWESTKTLWGSQHLDIGDSTDSSSNTQTTSKKGNQSRSSTSSRRGEPEEKVDRVQHICVVNGSVVTFKDFGFENFTNWFGDDSVLEANQLRCQPKFHLELDLTDVENKDIKIRLLDGYKLEIEAKRRIKGSIKPLRVKEFLHIPKGYRPEDLLLCKTRSGKLIVEDLTTAISVNTSSAKTKAPTKKNNAKRQLKEKK